VTTTTEAPPPDDAPTIVAPRPTRSWFAEHWYGLGLGIVAAVAGIIRFLNVLVWYPSCSADVINSVENHVPYATCSPDQFRVWGDSLYYYGQGYLLSKGHLYADSATWYGSGGTKIVPSAGDPPMYSAFLGLLQKLGIGTPTGQRLATSVIAIAGVVLIAMVGRRVAGRRAGLIAGAIAAVYPLLWINDGMLLSEGLYVPLIAVVLLVAYRMWDKPSWGNAAWLGAIVAVAALTRAEALLLFVALVIPLLWGIRELTVKRRVALVALCWAVGLAVMMPWFMFNLTRFKDPSLMTAQTGAVLSAANCDTTYYGDYIGYYANCYDEYVASGRLIGDPALPNCDAAAVAAANSLDEQTKQQASACWPDPNTLDESQRDKVARDAAVKYMLDNKRALPRVAVTRVLRMFDFYNPDLGSSVEPLGQNVRVNWAVEGRGKWQSEAGFLMYFVLLPFAVAGTVILVRRRIPVSPLMAMPILITVSTAFTFGITRYRVPVDLMLTVLAAVAVEAIVRRRWAAPDDTNLRFRRGERPSPTDAEPEREIVLP
jgi:4-amino-4-deoxy-L-arabinose transferase-like glycosyltransferase